MNKTRYINALRSQFLEFDFLTQEMVDAVVADFIGLVAEEFTGDEIRASWAYVRRIRPASLESYARTLLAVAR